MSSLKKIRVNWAVTLLQQGLVQCCCYVKKKEFSSWVAMRWNSEKHSRRVRRRRPIVRERPRHTLIKIKCYRRLELVAVLYVDNTFVAKRFGKMWKRDSNNRSFTFTDYRYKVPAKK